MGSAGDDPEGGGCSLRSVLLNHHLSCLDYGNDRVALLKLKLFGASAGNGAFDEVVADADDDVGHDVAELNLFDFSTQFVSG